MELCYWELNPEELLKSNPYYQEIKEEQLTYKLIEMYTNSSEKCIELLEKVNFSNFKEIMVQILEIEALLAEISFYITEINLKLIEKDFVIEKEYLLDYYYKIGIANKEGNFLVSLLRNKVIEQRNIRFSCIG